MKSMKEIREMSLEEIKSDVERIKNEFPQLASSCDAIHFDRQKGAINRDYKYLLNEVEECNDSDLQDYYTFNSCIEKLDARRKEIANFWECGLSDFGEAIAMDKEIANKEYEALKASYETLVKELNPQMQESYKGYKAHCEWCRIPCYNWDGYQEEADEDDLFASILGM